MQFTLVPFEPVPDIPSITGSVTRSGSNLRIEFKPLILPGVVWPQPDTKPQRKDNLWQSTCFECFIGTSGAESYLEINASPRGDWQVYDFTSYRELTSTTKRVSVQVETNNYSTKEKSIVMNIDLGSTSFVTRNASENWKISVSVVLKRESGDHLYYASSHPSPKPDFHLASLRSMTLAETSSPT